MSSDFNVDCGIGRNVCGKVKSSTFDFISWSLSSFPVIAECPLTQFKKNDFSVKRINKIIPRTNDCYYQILKIPVDLINCLIKLSISIQSPLLLNESPLSLTGRLSSPDHALCTRKKKTRYKQIRTKSCCSTYLRFGIVSKNVFRTHKNFCWTNINFFLK